MVRLLDIPYDAEASFLQRPNRFLGIVDIIRPEKKQAQLIHVHDPGRLPGLLAPGRRVLLRRAASPRRKTAWDLLAVENGDEKWVFINSIYHRRIAESLWSRPDISPVKGIMDFRAEVRWGQSRLDFALILDTGERVMVEVKGCTMALDEVALFPDAPTARGARHLEELIRIRRTGASALLLVLVFRDEARCFAPYDRINPRFARIFREALASGVNVIVLMIGYDGKSLNFKGEIPLCV